MFIYCTIFRSCLAKSVSCSV